MIKNNLNVVITGYYGFDNFGDDAALSIVSNHLLANGYSVTVLGKGSVDSRFPNLKFVDKKNFYKRCQAIRAANLVILGPGGILKRTANGSPFSLSAVALHDALLARITRTPYRLHSVSASSSLNWFDKKVMSLCLKNAVSIGVRDSYTYELIESLGLEVCRVPDTVFAAIDGVSKKPIDNMKLAFAPSSSEYLQGGREASLRYEVFCKAIAAKNIDVTGVISQGGVNGDSMLIDVARTHGVNITEVIDCSVLDARQVIDSLSGVTHVISQRFHSGLIAAATGCLVMLVGRDSKLLSLESLFPNVKCTPASDVGGQLDCYLAEYPEPQQRREIESIVTDLSNQSVDSVSRLSVPSGYRSKIGIGRTLLLVVILILSKIAHKLYLLLQSLTRFLK